MIEQDLQDSGVTVARLRDRHGRTTGTGFVVGNGYLLTCTHVVCDALGVGEFETIAAGTILPAEFPLVTPGVAHEYRVVSSYPRLEQPVIGIPEDMTLLQCAEAIPSDDTSLFDTGTMGQTIRTYGYNRENGSWYQGTCAGPVAEGWVQLNLHNPAQESLNGLSGSPVWSENRRVVGMLVAKRHELTAYMIPAGCLLRVFPMLKTADSLIPGKSKLTNPAAGGLGQMRRKQAEARYERLSKLVAALQEQYELETRPEEQMRILELQLKPKQKLLSEAEAELLVLG